MHTPHTIGGLIPAPRRTDRKQATHSQHAGRARRKGPHQVRPRPPPRLPQPPIPTPNGPTRAAGPGGVPGRAGAEGRPAHRRPTAPARQRGPSPSMAPSLTVPTRSRRGDLEKGPGRVSRAGRPRGRRPRRRGFLLPAGYSTWVRVTGRHEAGSEHCPSAAILPGDRASRSSQ